MYKFFYIYAEDISFFQNFNAQYLYKNSELYLLSNKFFNFYMSKNY